MVRLGGPVHGFNSPEEWIGKIRALGYRAAYTPVQPDADDATVAAYRNAAKEADIVIAEVGAWSNPLSPKDDERSAARKKCKDCLDLADRIGANCCVNVAGSLGERWAGPFEKDLTPDAFDAIVEVVREIIDDVKPTRTFFALETMPYMLPDSVDSYIDLMTAIDRKQFGVHLDPVNLINSPRRYWGNGQIITDLVAKLGSQVKSCHAKDTLMHPDLTTHIDEVRPGLGILDYATYLRELDALPFDVPLMLEHLKGQDQYKLGADYIRSVAMAEGIEL